MKIKRDEKYGLISESGNMILDLKFKSILIDPETLNVFYY
jgi:ribose 5-phosphate isomerase